VTLFDAAPGDPADRSGRPAAGPSQVKLVVAYDGTDFRGFAAQPSQRTVAGVLTNAITKVLRHDTELS
jgi:tRNA pseudouridine38-40 synthase